MDAMLQSAQQLQELAIMLNLALLMPHLDQGLSLAQVVTADLLITHAPLLEVLLLQIMDAPL